MSEPNDIFCEMLSGVPQDERDNVVSLCNLAVGCKLFLAQPGDDPEIVGDLPKTEIEALHRRLNWLAEKEHIKEEFMIPGLIHYLTEYYRKLSDSSTTSNLIDDHLETLSEINEELDKPEHERKDKRTDKELLSWKRHVEETMSGRPSQKTGAGIVFDHIEREAADRFPDGYWSNWRLRTMLRR